MSPSDLKRDISKTHLLFISFAAIFGSGWLFAPLYAAQIAGPASLIAWFLGAIMAMVIGITMAEVVVLFPKSGGLTQIAKLTHGEFLSLSLVIFNLLVFIILPAIEVRAVLQYLSSYFSILGHKDHSISALGYATAILLLALITLVNLYGGKVTGAITKGVVLFKLVTPILICCSFFYTLGFEKSLNFSRLNIFSVGSGQSIPWTQIFQAIATSGIIFSFNGFNQATLFAGEAKNPQRTIPFAILGSLAASGLLYFVIQYVFLMAIPSESFAHGWDKLSFSGDEGPFAGIAGLLGLHWLLSVIYADAVVSPLGTAFSYASAAPRLFYSLVEGTPMQDRFLRLNRHGVSGLFILVTFALECLAFAFLPSLRAMIALLVAAFVLCYTVAPASLLVLRRTEPNLKRPFRIRFAPLVSFLALFFSNLMVYSCGWIALRNLIFVSSILFCFYLFIHRRNLRGKTLKSNLVGCSWFLFELLTIGILTYLNEIKPLHFSTILIGNLIISCISILMSQQVRSK